MTLTTSSRSRTRRLHNDLLNTARHLLGGTGGIPLPQTDIRRAVSTGYYALFHFVSYFCTEALFLGATGRFSRAKNQAYRSLDHRGILDACRRAQNKDMGFTKEIRDLAILFLNMHRLRNAADYDGDPSQEIKPPQALHKIGECDNHMEACNLTNSNNRIAFAILVLVKTKSR